MWRVTIKGLLAHKLRLALTALAIVLGVTFIAGTFVLTDTLNRTFDTLFGNIYQNVDFQVRGVAQLGTSGGNATRNPVPESLLATVQAVPGVEAANGSVTGYAQFIRTTARRSRPAGHPHSGSSSTRTSRSRPSTLRRANHRRHRTKSPWTSARRRSTTSRSARQCASCLRGPTRTFTISGLMRFGTANNLAGATLAAFDTPTAQASSATVGQFDNINVVSATGSEQDVRPTCHRAASCPAASRW